MCAKAHEGTHGRSPIFFARIACMSAAPARKTVSRERALTLFEGLKKSLRFVSAASGRAKKFPLVAAGSVRRGAPRTKDLDVLVVVPDDTKALPKIKWERAARFEETRVLTSGPARRTSRVRLPGTAAASLQLDLFLVRRSDLPFALFHHTGSRAYNIRTRAHAKKLGYRLNQYGLFDAKSGARVPRTKNFTTEREITAFLGLTYRAPADRDEK